MFKAFGRKKNGKSKHKTEEKAPENAVEQYKANVVSNIENGADQFPEESRAQAPLHEDDFGLGDGQRSRSHSRFFPAACSWSSTCLCQPDYAPEICSWRNA